MNAPGTKRKENPEKPRKKTKKVKPAQLPILTPERLQTLLLNLKETVCGIDLSLASPSVAVLDPIQKVLHSYVIRQRKGDLAHNEVRITEGPMTGWLFRLTCLPEPTVAEHTAMYRFARFMPILDMIMNAVGNAKTVAIEDANVPITAMERDVHSYKHVLKLTADTRGGLIHITSRPC